MPLQLHTAQSRVAPLILRSTYWYVQFEDSYFCEDWEVYRLNPTRGTFSAMYLPYAFGFEPFLMLNTITGVYRVAVIVVEDAFLGGSDRGCSIDEFFGDALSEWARMVRNSLWLGTQIVPANTPRHCEYRRDEFVAFGGMPNPNPLGVVFNEIPVWAAEPYKLPEWYGRIRTLYQTRHGRFPRIDPVYEMRHVMNNASLHSSSRKNPLEPIRWNGYDKWLRVIGFTSCSCYLALEYCPIAEVLRVPNRQAKRFLFHLVFNEGVVLPQEPE